MAEIMRYNFSYLNGILAIIFGLVALLFPNIAIKGLAIIVGLLILVNPFGSTRFIVVLIGIYAIIYGVFSIVSTSKNQ